ncbi:uncharacterized protein MONOS_15368 [Monocercomonoides exilis]|uniref:uncharacterized protein n=1 Tax=Monocercomonoides exilis TaxID=2049356 RepID=UPI0035595DEA|nr:hypothetical protein MONOS_15368 [Monocercomonoides exilis]|eukprot:MONOS_15368.1-p1 / transcript=MONOS_15368.1 / gene=MONOS_15368 / organism=Monocercomonoides_exilis_PA203 / gene_product=unspecified product / transcript_product=unspecified product / location=Mono_scaffold01211:4974-5723(+) / protein_length=249 / sequence_SO=supercontig / SO=protein_coding / is_pseudo=false
MASSIAAAQLSSMRYKVSSFTTPSERLGLVVRGVHEALLLSVMHNSSPVVLASAAQALSALVRAVTVKEKSASLLLRASNTAKMLLFHAPRDEALLSSVFRLLTEVCDANVILTEKAFICSPDAAKETTETAIVSQQMVAQQKHSHSSSASSSTTSSSPPPSSCCCSSSSSSRSLSLHPHLGCTSTYQRLNALAAKVYEDITPGAAEEYERYVERGENARKEKEEKMKKREEEEEEEEEGWTKGKNSKE